MGEIFSDGIGAISHNLEVQTPEILSQGFGGKEVKMPRQIEARPTPSK